MNCTDAKHLIHLDSGNDLKTDEEMQLAEHMNTCAECRSYHAGMAKAMSALFALRDSGEIDVVRSGKSVWPAVDARIRGTNAARQSARKFNFRVALLSVCSLSLALVTIVQTLATMRSSMAVEEFVPARTVSNPGVLPSAPGNQSMMPLRSPEYRLPPVSMPRQPQSF